MGKAVLIGGGEVGNHGTAYETAPFDREIVTLSGKAHPSLLFIGLASSHPDASYRTVGGIFSGMYACATDELTLDDLKNRDSAREKIARADIIYVGGGNTRKLTARLRRYGADAHLAVAWEKDKVLCGISAGAICQCAWGSSDSGKRVGDTHGMLRVRGLGFIPVLFCPHWASQGYRRTTLPDMLRRTHGMPALALDNAALSVDGEKYRIIRLDAGSAAVKCVWRSGTFLTEEIPDEGALCDLVAK